MTTESNSRATARENKVWAPFVYSFPFDSVQSVERVIVFGLYANSHMNYQKYLTERETEDLANMLTDYNSKLAELTTQEQVVVAGIVSRRYLSSVDKIIHDQKMASKRAGIEADDDIWDARIAALSADRAALETMSAKVTSETDKTSAKITEIQAYIEIESLRLTEADIEIAEKEIQSAKVDIQKLDTRNQILKIQIDTVQAAQELVEVDLKISRTKIDIAETERTSNKIDLLDSEFTIEQARTDIAEAEVPAAEARATLARAKIGEAQDEVDYLATQEAQTGESYQNKLDLMNTRHAGQEDALTMHRQAADLEIDNKLAFSELDKAFANTDGELQPQLDAARIAKMNADVVNVSLLENAHINSAKTLAAAAIVTDLTHTIMKAK